MKTLIVSPYFYPEGGGLENYAYNIAKGLAEKGHKITVLCATKENHGKTETLDGIKIIREKPDIIISNTPVKLNLYFTISKLLEKEKFDLVNSHTPVPYYADMACYASKKHNIPFILTYHNDNTHLNPITKLLGNIYNHTISPMTLKLSRKIITPSPFCFNESRHLEKHKEKLSLILPGVDFTRFKPKKSKYISKNYNLPEDSKIVLFVGQLGKPHKHKGIDTLIDAFSDVCNSNPYIYLVIVGKGDAEKYKAQSKRQKIEKNVIFAGYIDGDILPKYYQSADVFVLPSTTEQEGFGMTLIEAMACGTPVIGTRIGGIPHVIRDKETGLLVWPKDRKALSQAIKTISSDKELNENLIKKGIKEVKEKYDWKIAIDKTEKLADDYAKEIQ